MNFNSPLPFELGETLKGTDSDGNLINTEIVGKLFWISANNLSGRGIKERVTSRPVLAVAARNTAGQTMLGKRIVRFERTAGYAPLQAFDGYTDTLYEKGIGVLDEFIATNGVADDDIAWVVLSGPVTILTSKTGANFNGDIAVGAQLVAGTGTTTGATTAGRPSNVTLPGQTGATSAFQAAANLLGRALSARTTGETDSDLLINAEIKAY